METKKMSREAGSRYAGKKRLFKENSDKHSFLPCRQAGWSRKTTARIVAFAVVFVLLSPFLLVPNTAHAFSFGDLAGSILGDTFGDTSSYVGGSVSDYLTGNISGLGKVISQRVRLQSLYGPAMKEFITQMDKDWLPGVSGFFTLTLFAPQEAFQSFMGSEPETFQESDSYSGPVENAWKMIDYQNNQSAAQTAYMEAEEDIRQSTSSETTEWLGDSEVGKDITASQVASDSLLISGLTKGIKVQESGGGIFGSIFGGIADFFNPFD